MRSSLKQVGLNFGSSRRPVSGAQLGLVMKQTFTAHLEQVPAAQILRSEKYFFFVLMCTDVAYDLASDNNLKNSSNSAAKLFHKQACHIKR
jgi:hypothetical protein